MALIEREPTLPDVQASYSNLGALTEASTVRSSIDTKLSANYGNNQTAIALLEALATVIGNGAISGGTISAGAGLSVDIAAWEAILGTIVGNDASTTVGGLAANDVNYIFATQSGTFLSDTDIGAIPLASYGAYMLWGTATTDASSVTAVSNVRDSFAAGLFTATTQTYTASNVSTDRSYDANATTLDEVADVLGTLIADLRAKGIVA